MGSSEPAHIACSPDARDSRDVCSLAQFRESDPSTSTLRGDAGVWRRVLVLLFLGGALAMEPARLGFGERHGSNAVAACTSREGSGVHV